MKSVPSPGSPSQTSCPAAALCAITFSWNCERRPPSPSGISPSAPSPSLMRKSGISSPSPASATSSGEKISSSCFFWLFAARAAALAWAAAKISSLLRRERFFFGAASSLFSSSLLLATLTVLSSSDGWLADSSVKPKGSSDGCSVVAISSVLLRFFNASSAALAARSAFEGLPRFFLTTGSSPSVFSAFFVLAFFLGFSSSSEKSPTMKFTKASAPSAAERSDPNVLAIVSSSSIGLDMSSSLLYIFQCNVFSSNRIFLRKKIWECVSEIENCKFRNTLD